MSWENLSERLAQPFCVRNSFRQGAILYPDHQLEIDEWLTSAAETDQELRELEIPRVWFLQNHWQMEKLAELEWANHSSVTRRQVWALYIGHRAYFVFSGGFKYWLVAATDQIEDPAFYREVLRSLLKDPRFVPTPPLHIRYFRPELDPHVEDQAEPARINMWAQRPSTNMFREWSRLWADALVWGFWHETEDRAQLLH
jgi:hypothetical protein